MTDNDMTLAAAAAMVQRVRDGAVVDHGAVCRALLRLADEFDSLCLLAGKPYALATVVPRYADDEYTGDEYTPEHLRDLLGGPPAPTWKCSQCERRTWARAEIGESCRMPQPNGSRCLGIFQ